MNSLARARASELLEASQPGQRRYGHGFWAEKLSEKKKKYSLRVEYLHVLRLQLQCVYLDHIRLVYFDQRHEQVPRTDSAEHVMPITSLTRF